MANLFEIMLAAFDNTELDMTRERDELESEFTEAYIDAYSSNVMGIELSTSQIKRIRNVGLEWIKDVNEGNGEWSRIQHEARVKLIEQCYQATTRYAEEENMEYHETMRAELSPDVYDGPNCDQVRHRWHAHCEGDIDSDYTESLEMAATHFPPGTKVLVLEPECPECHQIPELCRGDGGCTFDWDKWIEDRYA